MRQRSVCMQAMNVGFPRYTEMVLGQGVLRWRAIRRQQASRRTITPYRNEGNEKRHIPDSGIRPAIIALEVSFGKIIGLGVSQASKQLHLPCNFCRDPVHGPRRNVPCVPSR